MKNHFKAYLQFLLRAKMQDITESFNDRKDQVKPRQLIVETFADSTPDLDVQEFLNDLLNNDPLNSLKHQLEFLKKNQLIQHPEEYLSSLEEILLSYQVVLEIAITYLHEFVNDVDLSDQIMYEFESIGDMLDSKIRQAREQIYKKVA